MAKTDKRSGGASSSYFLGCFGFSRKIYSDKPMKDDGGEKKKKMKKKKFRSLWSKFRLKNSEIKPSPTEETKQKTFSSVEEKTDRQKVAPVIRRLTDRENNTPVDDKSMNRVTKETKQELRELTTDRSKLMEPLVSSKEDTCPKRVSTSSQPETKPSRGKKFDPVIGISIIILTLMIMLIWGRLCAILCTSAWCYFLPRLREAAALVKRKRGSAFVPGLMKSESYNKKKVVLDGFLIGRQNRVSSL